jgi:DNA-binding sugar fermentation-stimulating protein
MLVFLVQRKDATSLSPNARADPAFTDALRKAVAAGVVVRCYRCAVDLRGCTLLGPIPFDLRGEAEEG